MPHSGDMHGTRGRERSSRVIQFGAAKRKITSVPVRREAACNENPLVCHQGRGTASNLGWLPPKTSFIYSNHTAGNTERIGGWIIEFGRGLRQDQDLAVG